MAGATLVEAQAEALKSAASNEAGAMTGLMGVGMVGQINNMGGMGAQGYYNMNQNQQGQPQPQQAAAPAAPPANAWKCSCGCMATGKFCPECGSKKPGQQGWACPKCGANNLGKFCQECGTKKPQGVPQYRCDKCGWQPADPTKPPKFCPECGDPFGDEDMV